MTTKQTKTMATKTAPRKLWVSAAILLGLGILVAVVFNFFQASPQISEIAPGGATCTSNIASIAFQNECGQSSYMSATFKCQNSVSSTGTDFPTCTSYVDALAQAQKVCGLTCSSPSPSPTSLSSPAPSRAPTPTPTAYPSPSPTNVPTQQITFSCNVNAYKLKTTDDPTANPANYATLDRRIDPSQVKIVPGEHYALMVNSMANQNISVATVSAFTSNVSGSEEPIKVVATTPYCSSTDSWGKYMGCTHPGINYLANTPQALGVGMTIKIEDNVYQKAKTSIRFGLYNITSGGTGYGSECYSTMWAAESSSPFPSQIPSPTPTPTPVPPTGCTYERSTCLNSLLGGECKLLLLCPTPKPKPILTPQGKVVEVRPTPSPLPIAPEGCYYQRRICARSLFGGTCAPVLSCPKSAKTSYSACMQACRNNSPYTQCLRTCLVR